MIVIESSSLIIHRRLYMIEMVPFQYSEDITVINREQFEAHMRLYEDM